LNNSKIQLNDAQEFQFLSNEERENDIGAVENNIIRWRNEIAQLEKEMSLLYRGKNTDPYY
jgi:hypothetical protein